MSESEFRIGQFITQYPYERQYAGEQVYFCSGAERVAQAISNELAELGCDVKVCTSAAGRSYSTSNQGNVTVKRSPSLFSINTTQIAPTQVVDPLFDDHDFDLVHAHNSTSPGVIAGWVYSQVYDVPFVITHHGGENYEDHGSLVRRLGLSLYTNYLIEPLFSSANVAVSPTEGYIKESSALSSASQVEVISNGVNVDEYTHEASAEAMKRRLDIDPEEFLVFYLGSLHPRKGADVLLNGFVQFHERFPNSHLVVGGGGSLRDALEQSVTDHGITGAVTIPGFIPEAEKPTYMAAADVFVLPSITPGAEVFPLVLLEAAAAKTPLVVSQFSTLESIIDPMDAGILITPGSAESISKELEHLYTEPDKRHELAMNAFELAKQREWSRVAEQYLDLYDDLIV